MQLILNKALPPNISKLNALLFLERMVRFDRTFDKAFLINLAKIIGFISKVGGLTKFTQIADQVQLLVRRVVQISLCLTKINDFSLIDMLNGSIYTRV